MKNCIFVLRIVILSSILVSCTKEKCQDKSNPTCENYDACFNKTAVVSPEFKIYESVDGTAYEADTIWHKNPIIFSAKNQPGYSFKWNLRSNGFSQTYKDTLVTFTPNLVTPKLPAAQFYTVTLVVSKDNGDCKDLKSSDSISKQFYLWPDEYVGNFQEPIRYLPIFGTYAGYKTSKPNELVYVTLFDSIFTLPNLPCLLGSDGKKDIFNIIRNLAYNKFSSEKISPSYSGAFKRKGASAVSLNAELQFDYPHQWVCYGSRYLINYKGTAKLDVNDSRKIIINYSYQDTISKLWVNDNFTGIKIKNQ